MKRAHFTSSPQFSRYCMWWLLRHRSHVREWHFSPWQKNCPSSVRRNVNMYEYIWLEITNKKTKLFQIFFVNFHVSFLFFSEIPAEFYSCNLECSGGLSSDLDICPLLPSVLSAKVGSVTLKSSVTTFWAQIRKITYLYHFVTGRETKRENLNVL